MIEDMYYGKPNATVYDVSCTVSMSIGRWQGGDNRCID